ncbi:MAG TPA: endo-1,4-beta-xylanase, partial [Anaerolineales bacterium]|nr:endo-1,4-beta-xylanase [Anaerolineales bacterium]
MTTQNEWETLRLKADETVERHRKGEARIRFISSEGKPIHDMKVQVTQKTQDFLFGNLIFDLVWNSPLYKADLFKQRFLELFNFAIFPFYWPFYEKTPGQTEWEKLMPVLEWCRANGVTPKGHPLVWPYSAGVPEWLYDMPDGSVETLIKARVLNLVKGFSPWIQIWDVTNEAVNHISWNEATHPSFRSRYHEVSMWRGIEVSGAFKREIPIPEAADWVEKSFRWAYAANPQAMFIVNDYNQEFDLNVRQRFFDLIRELQHRGAPVSGIGMQVHPVNYWLWPHQIWDTLEMYAELDCPIHITELHQPAWEAEIEGGWRTGTWTLECQAEFIEQIYRQCFGHPSVVSINYWGFSDRNIWMPGGGLMDAEYQPKPVFRALKNLIKGEWITAPFTAHTDENGEVNFRGFYGQYEITQELPGQKHPSWI